MNLKAMQMVLTVTCFLILTVPVRAGDNVWKPIDPAHLALKASAIEKDADAETLFWDVIVDLKPSRPVFSTYIRIKIFTERGRESQSSVDLPYFGETKIEDVAGRTIKADGKIIELEKSAIFERTIIRGKGIKLKAWSFVLPAVEPGDIIEYRWREVRSEEFFLRLPFQRDIPVQSVKYFFKGSEETFRQFSTRTFNAQDMRVAMEKDNGYTRSMVNVPSLHEEPDMPPKDEVSIWALMYFSPYMGGTSLNKIKHDEFKSITKPNDELRAAASEIISNAATPEQKIERLFEFCRSKIKRIDAVGSGLTASEREKYKSNKTAKDTLKRAIGTGEEINYLFAALAIAAGFDARLAMIASRDEIFFAPAAADDFLRVYFMRNNNIAIRVNDKWRFFDPASSFVSYGMLLWQEEGQKAMILGPDFETLEPTPMSPPEKSRAKRTAKISLSEDGSLEADVRIEYYGHMAVEMKRFNADDSLDQQEKNLREQIKKRMSAAELSNIRIEGLTDPEKPFVYAFHARMPGYAQRTGKRLFFQPAFFQYGSSPRFTATERKYDVYFRHPWAEEDYVEINLPERFVLDNAESIGSFPIANLGKYSASLSITKDERTLIYKRNLIFGIDERLLFPPSSYQQLKKIFETTHDLDTRMISIKQGAGNL